MVDKPTAIPSTPCARSSGNLTGSATGSLPLPSYDGVNSVIFELYTTSRANLDNLTSIYLAAAALSPVRVFPQFPCKSSRISF